PEQLIAEPEVIEPDTDRIVLRDTDVEFPDIPPAPPKDPLPIQKITKDPVPEALVEEKTPAVGPAPATIILAKGSPPYRSIEVQCGDTYRERANFSGGKATLSDVPRDKCRVTFQGGPPGKNNIQGGETKVCEMGATMVCRLQ
ncbi:MAG: hypothetical protein HN348_27605, partial [Proteobacteria bacterium]|nr:hypothetical protein [Pseudomonadota bacterium]